MRAISIATLATALGLFVAPAAAYRLALPVSAAAQPRAACSTAGRAARASSIDMIGGNNLDGTGSFRTVQEYPCDLDVKIIGNNEGPFVDDMVTLCAERTGQKEEDISAVARCRRRPGSGRADRPRRHGSRRPRACARGCPLGATAELQPLRSLSEARPQNAGYAAACAHPGARWRDKGKYRAITLRLHFENADQVYDVYAAINRDPRVKFKL